MYVSRLARFSSADQVGGSPSTPQSWNRYSYVLNNPVGAVDPTGMYCQWDDGTQDDSPFSGGATQQECSDQGGTWISECGVTSICTTSIDTPGMPGGWVNGRPVWGLMDASQEQAQPNIIIYHTVAEWDDVHGKIGGSHKRDGGNSGSGTVSRFVNSSARLAACAAALPMIFGTWDNGGGSLSIGGGGGFTAAVPTGGIDVNASATVNADAWGKVSLTVSGGSNIPMGGQGATGAQLSGGVQISSSNGTVDQLPGPSLGGWVGAGPVTFQASQNANNGPISTGLSIGGGIGGTAAAPNLIQTAEVAQTNCFGALIDLASKLF